MKKRLFVMVSLCVVSMAYTLASTISLEDFPMCEKNISGAVICPSFTWSMVPENKLVVVRDFCPAWDMSPTVFDNECQMMTGVVVVSNKSGVVTFPFGSVSKYMKITSPLDDASLYAHASMVSQIDSLAVSGAVSGVLAEQKFLKTWTEDTSSLLLYMMVLSVLGGYSVLWFTIFKK